MVLIRAPFVGRVITSDVSKGVRVSTFYNVRSWPEAAVRSAEIQQYLRGRFQSKADLLS